MKKSGIFLRSLLILILLVLFSHSYSQTIINKYAAVLSYQECDNALTVDSTTGFSVGDTIMMIQMKGAIIDTSNTVVFGNVLSYNGCGNYEYNVVKAINGNNISLVYDIIRDYDIPLGKVQLVSVPSYQDYTVTQPHTCMAWNGVKGGVFTINIANTLTLNNSIDVSGKGFTGGKSDQNPTVVGPVLCNYYDFYMAPDFDQGSMKGEGIAMVSVNKSYGRGKLANGGGGGNAHNSGGGGGGNGNIGGTGGSEYFGCNSNFSNNLTGGVSGVQLNYSNITNKIFLGGGGGSAQTNNLTISNGGNGGGIVIITAGNLIGNGQSVKANGQDGLQCINNGSFGSCHDGMAGGGGGGVIMLNVINYTGSANMEAKGGKGADETANAGYDQVGPGGGGSGGVIWHKNTALPGTVTSTVAGGVNGIVVYNGQSWGAQPGQSGQKLNNLILMNPVDSFNNSDITSDFSFSRTFCFTFSFNDLTVVTAGVITGYNWNFGDGSSNSSQQNPVHTFLNYGSYTVTLTVFTSNNCSESITKVINIPYNDFLSVSDDTTICSEMQVQMHAFGGADYVWSPATGLNNNSIADPVATVTNSIAYFVTAKNNMGCTDQDSVKIIYHPASNVSISADKDTINCAEPFVNLSAAGGIIYTWSPADLLNNSSSQNVIGKILQPTKFFVQGTDTNGCQSIDSIFIQVTDNVLLFVPNAFSPNGDGVNDEFLPKYNCDLDYIVFSVYNRFGQRVFSTGNKYIGWKGLQNGKDADIGTYFWIITGKDNSGKIIRKGDVTLIR